MYSSTALCEFSQKRFLYAKQHDSSEHFNIWMKIKGKQWLPQKTVAFLLILMKGDGNYAAKSVIKYADNLFWLKRSHFPSKGMLIFLITAFFWYIHSKTGLFFPTNFVTFLPGPFGKYCPLIAIPYLPHTKCNVFVSRSINVNKFDRKNIYQPWKLNVLVRQEIIIK